MDIYQIVVSSEDCKKAASGDHEASDKIHLSSETMWRGTYDPADRRFYQIVATLETSDLDEAFRVLNVWDGATEIVRHNPMHSLSVGDILVRDEEAFVVAGMGFTPVEFEV